MKKILFIIIVTLLTACGVFNRKQPKVEELPPQEETQPSTVELPTNIDGEPTQTDADRVQDKFPGYTLEQLYEGKVLYELNCALCHSLEKPSSESEEKWKVIVPDMVGKVNRRSINGIDAAGEEKILRYLITMGPAQIK